MIYMIHRVRQKTKYSITWEWKKRRIECTRQSPEKWTVSAHAMKTNHSLGSFTKLSGYQHYLVHYERIPCSKTFIRMRSLAITVTSRIWYLKCYLQFTPQTENTDLLHGEQDEFFGFSVYRFWSFPLTTALFPYTNYGNMHLPNMTGKRISSQTRFLAIGNRHVLSALMEEPK